MPNPIGVDEVASVVPTAQIQQPRRLRPRTLLALLTNRSKSTLYIYAPLDWGESASLSLWLKDKVSGKDLPEEFIADALPPPPDSKFQFGSVIVPGNYRVFAVAGLDEEIENPNVVSEYLSQATDVSLAPKGQSSVMLTVMRAEH